MSAKDEVIEKIKQEIKELEEKYAVTSEKRKTLERMMKLINKEVSEAEFLIHKTRSSMGLPAIELPTVSYNAYVNEAQKALSGVTDSPADRRSGVCATIEPYRMLVEDIPSLRVMPLDESLIDVPVRTISGPVDPYTVSNPLCEVIDTVVAARTVSSYPMIPSSGTKVIKIGYIIILICLLFLYFCFFIFLFLLNLYFFASLLFYFLLNSYFCFSKLLP